MIYRLLAQISVILSVLFLFNKAATGKIKLDVLFLIISLLFFIIAFIKKKLFINLEKFSPIFIALFGIFLSIIIGSIISFIRYGALPFTSIFSELKIFAGCIIIFIEIIILGNSDNIFLKWLIYSFLASFLVIIVAYLPEPILRSIPSGEMPNRFSGLIGNSNYYPTFMFLPTMIIYYLLFKEKFQKKNLTKILVLFLLFSLSCGLIIWSGARSGWLGLFVSLTLFVLLSIKTTEHKFKKILLHFSTIILAVLIGFVLLPPIAKVHTNERMSAITGYVGKDASSSKNIQNTQNKEIQNGNVNHPLFVSQTKSILNSMSSNQDRLNIWKQGIQYIMDNPFGYGFSYYYIINIKSAEEHASIHSLILETLLIGGILLCISIIYLLVYIFKKYLSFLRHNFVVDMETVLISSLIGFLISTLFLSALQLRWFWILLAITIAWQMDRENKINHTMNSQTESIKYPSIGATYQCYKQPKAMLFALSSFRKFYPNSSVNLISDNGYDYSHVAKHFNCTYQHLDKHSGSIVSSTIFSDKIQIISWLSRLIETAKNSKEDYLIILEDDVWVLNKVSLVKYDLNGINIYEYKLGKNITSFLKTKNNAIPKNMKKYFYGGCGGAIISKKFILDNFSDISNIEKVITELEYYREKIYTKIYTTDYWLTVLVLYFNGTIGQYPGFCETWHSDYYYRRYISKNIEILHQYKNYYNKNLSSDEIKIIGYKI